MKDEIVFLNSESATHRLILLHGWGADAEDLIPLAKEITSIAFLNLEIAAFRAPQLHPQGFGKMWYPLFPHDWEAVPNAVQELEERIKAISTNLIPLSKTIVLGFSQGGAMALEIAANLSIGGVIACSSYSHPKWVPHTNMCPVFLTHGKFDEVVPFSSLQRTINLLNKSYVDSDLYSFDGGHEIPHQLIQLFRLKLNSWIN